MMMLPEELPHPGSSSPASKILNPLSRRIHFQGHTVTMVNEQDVGYLQECVKLAREALDAGDAPFGSLLVNPSTNTIHARDRNRTATGSSPLLPDSPLGPDPTLHPEFTLARWAGLNLSSQERAASTVYTSGEHCVMCSSAHAYVGLGRIVFAAGNQHLEQVLNEVNEGGGRVRNLAVRDVVRGVEVEGPVEDVARDVQDLYREWKHELKE